MEESDFFCAGNKSKNDEKEKMPTISRIRYYLPELRRLIKEGDCTESANSGETGIINSLLSRANVYCEY